jgi:hypothetical protein
MKRVPESAVDLVDLVDLKMLPAWVNQPAQAEPYSRVDGERTERGPSHRPPRARHHRRKPSMSNSPPPWKGSVTASVQPATARSMAGRDRRTGRRQQREDRHPINRPVAPQVTVRFLPHPPALDSVIAQIKDDSLAYSLFSLARLFLEKPARYDVHLTAAGESPLLQLGEHGVVSADRQFLERNAFRFVQSDFYRIEITQSEPPKGNFTNVARCKLSGTLLGPTNHHDYQKRLRGLYEQRFSRRMSFGEYQQKVEILTDPQLVEKWKEDACKISTFTTLREETPVAFASAAEAERHFRERYLPGLIRCLTELTINGTASRNLSDRSLWRLVENEWVRATRSPSQMMQELATQFRQAGLHVFRHRRGMLFVSPIRARPFNSDAPISASIKAIIESVGAAAGIGRKDLADKLIANLSGEEAERAKLTLASDLRWLVSEGCVIEFNDGSLDLPRGKTKVVVEAAVPAAKQEIAERSRVEAAVPAANEPQAEIAESAVSLADAEIGGS